MEFFVISVTALAFVAAVIVLSYFGKEADAKEKRLDYVRQIGSDALGPELEKSFYERYIRKIAVKTRSLLKRPGEQRVVKNKKRFENAALIERQLRLAGLFMSAEDYSSLKQIFMLAVIALFVIIALLFPGDLKAKLMVGLVGFSIAVAGPTFFLRFRVKGHQQKIRDQLPDAMDLLGVCIEAGLGFDLALVKVAEKISGPFIDELMLVHREIQMGRTRKEALQNMANSSDIAELKTFVSALVQAEQLGIPIINVMRIQSAQLRVTRKQIAQEKGMKTPVKILLPLVGFIFPVMFIVLLGPTAINIIHEFSSGVF